jgi:hypothetical protein
MSCLIKLGGRHFVLQREILGMKVPADGFSTIRDSGWVLWGRNPQLYAKAIVKLGNEVNDEAGCSVLGTLSQAFQVREEGYFFSGSNRLKDRVVCYLWRDNEYQDGELYVIVRTMNADTVVAKVINEDGCFGPAGELIARLVAPDCLRLHLSGFTVPRAIVDRRMSRRLDESCDMLHGNRRNSVGDTFFSYFEEYSANRTHRFNIEDVLRKMFDAFADRGRCSRVPVNAICNRCKLLGAEFEDSMLSNRTVRSVGRRGLSSSQAIDLITLFDLEHD